MTIDIGVYYQGYHADQAFTYGIGNVSKELLDLLAITKNALYKGIAATVAGGRMGDIGAAIQTHVEQNGLNVIKSYTGHGIGRQLHEKPNVPNVGQPGEGIKLQEGMVIAIEPIATTGKDSLYVGNNGSVYTKDGGITAHYEHTVAIVNGKPKILTTFEPIENSIIQN